jgi:hypothetical protein
MENLCLFGFAPFWRKAADYNMNGGDRASRLERFIPTPTRLNPPLREVHFRRQAVRRHLVEPL